MLLHVCCSMYAIFTYITGPLSANYVKMNNLELFTATIIFVLYIYITIYIILYNYPYSSSHTFWDCIWNCFLGSVYTFSEAIWSTGLALATIRTVGLSRWHKARWKRPGRLQSQVPPQNWCLTCWESDIAMKENQLWQITQLNGAIFCYDKLPNGIQTVCMMIYHELTTVAICTIICHCSSPSNLSQAAWA